MTEVVAALVVRGDRFMICQRPRGKKRGLLWEFGGGKVEEGETKQQALIREIREELDAGLVVGDEYMAVTHVYPDITIHMTLFVSQLTSEPRLLEHEAMDWITVDRIDEFEFCPADTEILKRLKAEGLPPELKL